MSNQLQTNNGGAISRGTRSATSLISRLRKAKMFDQLCILVLDGSGSMSHELEDNLSKAEATANAAKELVTLLKKSSKSPSFSLGIICFADEVETRLHAQSVEKMNLSEINFDPFPVVGKLNKTLVHLGLKEAEAMGIAFLNSGDASSSLKRSVHIILMSDGYANDTEKALELAEQIKGKWADSIRINTSLLGRNEEEHIEEAAEFLIKIASRNIEGKPFYARSTTGIELRTFFDRSSTDE